MLRRHGPCCSTSSEKTATRKQQLPPHIVTQHSERLCEPVPGASRACKNQPVCLTGKSAPCSVPHRPRGRGNAPSRSGFSRRPLCQVPASDHTRECVDRKLLQSPDQIIIKSAWRRQRQALSFSRKGTQTSKINPSWALLLLLEGATKVYTGLHYLECEKCLALLGRSWA